MENAVPEGKTPEPVHIHKMCFNVFLEKSCCRRHGFWMMQFKEEHFMKKIATLVLSVFLLSAVAVAFPGSATLTVSANFRNDVYLMVDGQTYRFNQQSVTLENLFPGLHSVKVVRPGRGGRWNSMNSGQVLYAGMIQMRAGYYTDIMINRFGRALVDQQPINAACYDQPNSWQEQHTDGYDIDDPGSNYGGMIRPMRSSSFDQLIQMARSESFDNTRMSVIKTAADANYFSTDQIRTMMKLFTFDNSKLELAKYCYNRSVNKNDYYLLASELTFSSSKESLMRFIDSNR